MCQRFPDRVRWLVSNGRYPEVGIEDRPWGWTAVFVHPPFEACPCVHAGVPVTERCSAWKC